MPFAHYFDVFKRFQGPRLPLILYSIALIPLTVRSLIHMFKDDSGCQSIATIPLDTYPPGASRTIIAYQAHAGIYQLLFSFLHLLILFRWRCLLPLGCLLITLEFGIPIFIMGSGWKMMELKGTAPGFVAMWSVPFVFSVLCWLALPDKKDKQ